MRFIVSAIFYAFGLFSIAKADVYFDADVALVSSTGYEQKSEDRIIKDLGKYFKSLTPFELDKEYGYYLMFVTHTIGSTDKTRNHGTMIFTDSFGSTILHVANEKNERSENAAVKDNIKQIKKELEKKQENIQSRQNTRCLLCGLNDVSDQDRNNVIGMASLIHLQELQSFGVFNSNHDLSHLAELFYIQNDLQKFESIMNTDEVVFNKQMIRNGRATQLINEAIKDGAPEELIQKILKGYQESDAGEFNPLAIAIIDQDTATLSRLIDYGFDIQMTFESDEGMVNPLHYSVDFGNIETTRLLMEAGANPYAVPNENVGYAWNMAMSRNKKEQAKLVLPDFLASPNSQEAESLLVQVALFGQLDLFQEMFFGGISLSAKSVRGTPILHALTLGKNFFGMDNVPQSNSHLSNKEKKSINYELIELRNQLLVNKYKYGDAHKELSKDTYTKIAELEARIGFSNEYQTLNQNYYEILESALNTGIDTELTDAEGRTALQYAIELKDDEIASKLIFADAMVPQDGSSMLLASYQNNMPLMMEALLKKGADINQRNEEGHSLLHLAILNNDAELVRILIRNGADVNIVDMRGRTPLHYAYPEGNVELNDSHYQIIGQLMEAGVDETKLDYAGESAVLAYQSRRMEYQEEQFRAEQQRQEYQIKQQRHEQLEAERNQLIARNREIEKAQKARNDAALHRQLSQIAVGAGTAIGTALGESQNATNRMINQNNQIVAQNRLIAEENRRAQAREVEARRSAQAQAYARQQEQARLLQAQRQAQYQLSMQRQAELKENVERMESEKREVEFSTSITSTRVQLNKNNSMSTNDLASTNRPAKNWQTNAYGACMQAAESPIVNNSDHTLGSAIKAFKAGCSQLWRLRHSPSTNPAPLYCNTREAFSETIRKKLSEQGIGSYTTYAEDAWNLWQGNLGCSGRGG